MNIGDFKNLIEMQKRINELSFFIQGILIDFGSDILKDVNLIEKDRDAELLSLYQKYCEVDKKGELVRESDGTPKLKEKYNLESMKKEIDKINNKYEPKLLEIYNKDIKVQ